MLPRMFAFNILETLRLERKSVWFDGHEIWPLGNARISTSEKNTLIVSGIGASGFDGVHIEKGKSPSHSINFNSIPTLMLDGLLRVTCFGTTFHNQTITTSESMLYGDNTDRNLKLAYIRSYLPKNFTTIGSLHGGSVFDLEDFTPPPPPKPEATPAAGWAIGAAVVGAIAALWASFKPSHSLTITREYDGQGHLLKTTKTETWDPEPFIVTVQGRQYTVDTIGVKAENIYDFDTMFKSHAVQMCGSNLGSFEILSLK